MNITWFKHDANAHRDTKLKKLRKRYGLQGYGLYFYCLEQITDNINANNLTFKLEDDSEILADDLNIHVEEIQAMMNYMVELGLFENQDGFITCLKLAKRLDQSQTSNPKMREFIKNIKNSHDNVMITSGQHHDNVMITSGSVMQDKIRLDKIRGEKKKTTTKKEFLLPESINVNSWAEFEAHRKEIKKPLTDLSRTKATNILKCLSHDEQEYLINYSITGRYAGLFPDQLSKKPKTPINNDYDPNTDPINASRVSNGEIFTPGIGWAI